MESDSKSDILKNGDAPLKDDTKPNQKSKRSNRRRQKESTTRERPKKPELPTVLMPKFPSQKLVKKKKSDDKVESPDNKREDVGDDETTPMCPTDKLLENEEEEGGEGKEKEEQEEEQVDPTQEAAQPGIPLLVEYNDIKPTFIPEKPQKAKPGVNEGLSGRSENRKTKKALAMPSENEKTRKIESRKRETKKLSVEDNCSEDGKKSLKNPKRNTTKRLIVKGTTQKSVPLGPPKESDVAVNPTNSPLNKPDRSIKGSLPEKSMDEKAKKGLPHVQTPPPQVLYPQNKKDQKDQGSAGQKIKNSPSCQRLDQTTTAKKQKKKKGFLRNVYKKTKFWARKSDCITDPTMEMLARSYVPPDYNEKNLMDFQPDPKNWFKKYNEEEYNLRVKTNTATKKEEIFINNRPFWLARHKEDDEIPKVRIQLHRPLKQLYNKSPADILPKMSRTMPFYDPKTEHIKTLKLVDKTIGVEELDSIRDKEYTREAKDKAKEKELKRVSANTFYATMMFELDKVTWDEQQKKKESDLNQDKRKGPKRDPEQPKSSVEDEPPPRKCLTWSFPEPPKDVKDPKEREKVKAYKLQCYDRKARPIPPATNRTFRAIDHRVGEKKIPRKPVATSPTPSSGTSLSTKSFSNSSSAEGRKG